VDAALLMKGRRYNIFDIMERFSKFEEIEDACFTVQRKKVDQEQRHDQLLMENQHLEVQISQNSLKLRDLDSLKALGFGLAEFRMLRDIIIEVGEERGLIGNDAVKDFFQDLENYYYEYRRLRTNVSKLKAEKAQASASDTSNQIIGMFQNFFKQRSESLSESNPKYNPNTQVSGGEKKVKHVDNNDVASNHRPNSELQSESPAEILHSNKELQQEDDSYEISYKGQVIEREYTQNSNSKLEEQFNSALLSGSKMKIENEQVVLQDPKFRSRIRNSPSPSSPESYQVKSSTDFNLVSNGIPPNTMSYLAADPNESCPSLSSIQDGILNTLNRSMFGAVETN
jgi:hypothetical protein